ncbi:MAG: SGNH/GDSL hydrolase family protein [Paenisporosarcina sp.]
MRKDIIFCMSALMSLLLFPISTSAVVNGPISYVAIGDSLAAGQTPNREIDTGYSDLIAQEITRNQPLSFYSKDLSFPGLTTKDVLGRVRSKEARPLLSNANVITVSAGANDLLRLIKLDVKSGSISFQQVPADYSLNKSRENMTQIISELKKIAPEAEVYIMGYYFAYPHVRDSQKIGAMIQMDKLNAILAGVAKDAGVHFVPVDKGFGALAKDKVPNPSDVHPNSEGYRAMANSFFDVYSSGSFQVTKDEMPAANPQSFEEIITNRNNANKHKEKSAVLPSTQLKENFLALTELRPTI